MITMQDVFNRFFSEYKEKYGFSWEQIKACEDIIACRTSKLGGHILECDECGHDIIRYNSCRNRHCPLCQGLNKIVWVDQRKKDILDVPYFHLVFTLPKELHQLIYQNQEQLYKLMYKTVAETLSELCLDKKYLGAQPGFFSVLHTWGNDLRFHPHLHVVIMAGGLTENKRWVRGSKKFFIPVRVLSKKFRGKFLYYLKNLYHQDKLSFFKDATINKKAKKFNELINQCYAKSWYTYAQETFSGPESVIKYLGRYTHRIAISNERLVSINKDSVTIKVKGENGKSKTVTLKGVEFIRRFLMHILPKGFVKIRYYGLLANCNRKTKLALCKKLSGSTSYKPLFEGLKTIEILNTLFKRDVTICPECEKGELILKQTILKGASP